MIKWSNSKKSVLTRFGRYDSGLFLIEITMDWKFRASHGTLNLTEIGIFETFREAKAACRSFLNEKKWMEKTPATNCSFCGAFNHTKGECQVK